VRPASIGSQMEPPYPLQELGQKHQERMLVYFNTLYVWPGSDWIPSYHERDLLESPQVTLGLAIL
jgi:hypothetical protein